MDFSLNYLIQRGANISELQRLALQKFSNHKPADNLYIKIAAGINDLTCFQNHKQGQELVLSDESAQDIIERLSFFKYQIKSIYPTALIGYVTIPSVSFVKNRDFRLSDGSLKKSLFTNEQLQIFQSELDEKIEKINCWIKLENNRKQEVHNRGCRTVSWHSSVSKTSKKRRKHGTFRTVTRNKFDALYDGVHAISSVKHKWFAEVVKAIKAELDYTEREQVQLVDSDSKENTGNGGERETSGDESELESWNFKRCRFK